MLVPKLRFKDFENKYVEYKLKDITDFYKGNILSKSDIVVDGKIPCILYGELYTRYSEITKCIISHTNNKSENLFYSQVNDVLIPCSGETALDISTSTCVLLDNVALGGDLNILRPKKYIDGKYLSYLLSNKKRITIAKYAQGDSIVHLYADKIKNISIILPSLEEQKKVAFVLELLSKKIEIQQRKIDTLKMYKKGLIVRIYTKQYSNKEKLLKLINQKSNKNSNNEVNEVYSISNKDGFLLQSNQFKDRMIASEDISNYKIVKKDYFAYNPARINVGSIARMKEAKQGIISPMYICFICNEKILPDYLEYFYESSVFKYEMNKRLEGSVRMCLSYESMINIPIELPSLEEQRKSSQILNKIDEKIKKEENIYIIQNNLKKGLLQKMFI